MLRIDKRSKSKLCKKKITSLKGKLCFLLLAKINIQTMQSIVDTVNLNVKQQFENEYLCNSTCNKSLEY